MLLLFSVQQSNLQSHINAFHEGHRPFKCTHNGCSSAFAFKVCIHNHLQDILKLFLALQKLMTVIVHSLSYHISTTYLVYVKPKIL